MSRQNVDFRNRLLGRAAIQHGKWQPTLFFLRRLRGHDMTRWGRNLPSHRLERRAFQGVACRLAVDQHQRMAPREDQRRLMRELSHGDQQLALRFVLPSLLHSHVGRRSGDERGKIADGLPPHNPNRHQLVCRQRSRLIEQAHVKLPCNWHPVWLRAEDLQLHQCHQRVVHCECHLHWKFRRDDARDNEDAVQEQLILTPVLIAQAMIQDI
mmetsp:Transcript_27244/g.57853  ORF Transcript_27244/g.57853 Transcript_27244/m.57853 type:complete len:211 (+) Transcript_27244:2543-3175(+)